MVDSDVPGTGQQQRQSVVGHLLNAVIGNICDRDSQFACNRNRNVIQSDPKSRNDAAALRSPHDGFGDIRPTCRNRIDIAGQLNERVLVAVRRLDDLCIDLRQNLTFDVTIGPSAVGNENAVFTTHG